MLLTAIDFVLTVTRDNLPSSTIIPWTNSVLVATANARKHGNLQGITNTLLTLGWATQQIENRSVELINMRDSIRMPEIPPLDSFLSLLESDMPADTVNLLDWWWTNACTIASDPFACIAVLDVSRDETVADLRSVSLPAPGWSWLLRAASLQAGISRTLWVLNPDVYKAIAEALEQKSSGLTDHMRTMQVSE